MAAEDMAVKTATLELLARPVLPGEPVAEVGRAGGGGRGCLHAGVARLPISLCTVTTQRSPALPATNTALGVWRGHLPAHGLGRQLRQPRRPVAHAAGRCGVGAQGVGPPVRRVEGAGAGRCASRALRGATARGGASPRPCGCPRPLALQAAAAPSPPPSRSAPPPPTGAMPAISAPWPSCTCAWLSWHTWRRWTSPGTPRCTCRWGFLVCAVRRGVQLWHLVETGAPGSVCSKAAHASSPAHPPTAPPQEDELLVEVFCNFWDYGDQSEERLGPVKQQARMRALHACAASCCCRCLRSYCCAHALLTLPV